MLLVVDKILSMSNSAEQSSTIKLKSGRDQHDNEKFETDFSDLTRKLEITEWS